MSLSLPGAERLKVSGRQPSLPAGLRIYAVGDIHGRLDLLDDLLSRIALDIASRPACSPVYVFLGDYVDRGSSSRETIDRLIELRKAKECVFLKGNHELIALKCLSDRALFDQWMRLGGMETLISYGVPPEALASGLASGKQIAELQAAFHNALPQGHLRFFRDLQGWFACGDFFFAHAGVRPNVELSHQKESDLLWIREEFLTSNDDFGKIIVHGHTPTLEVEVGPNRVNIDTGAFATGRLTCLVIEGESLSVIDTF
ncbi:MAG: Metallophosphoesterase [Bradyrhizobium sp.]|nr:Metallophosphoesterase [Bradyrhizobium sp.]